jgi:hypothetical protein
MGMRRRRCISTRLTAGTTPGAIGLVLALLPAWGCNVPGEGEGQVTSTQLEVQDCWSGAFDLQPDFFATIPYRDTQQIRVQRGNDLQEVSDGVAVLVNEASSVRPVKCTLDSDCASNDCIKADDNPGACPDGFDRCCTGDDRRGQPLTVGLPPQLLNEIAPGVTPPGPPPPVSLALYLQFSCHNQNVVLYAVDGTITFEELFDGDPNENAGAEKLTDAHFDVMVADPREALPGTLEIPADKQSPVTGWFRFFFKRGQPGQPFP